MVNEQIYDVLVIGGGPAGMMAAIAAAQEGASVVLLEKNKALGKKLLITGGGRCNLTNAIFDDRALASRYGKKGSALLSPLSKWNVQQTVDFFESRGMPIKTEAEGRMFPKSDRAQNVLDVLVHEMKRLRVSVVCGATVSKLLTKSGVVVGTETSKGCFRAHAIILATGGTAHPETGSTGEGFRWLATLGHAVNPPSAALVPIKTKELWSHKLQGVSLPLVRATLFSGNTKIDSRTGKILFTHFGLSGPLILNMSATIGETTRGATNVSLVLDLFPTLDHQALDEKLRTHLASAQNKKWVNALKGFSPPLLAAVLIERSGIDPELFVNKIPRAARLAFVKFLKHFTITPTGLLSPEKAIVSSGGVTLAEVDFKTMRSKKIPNLYLAGDILDFDRPSGGFSLQVCWTTGVVAGTNAAKILK